MESTGTSGLTETEALLGVKSRGETQVNASSRDKQIHPLSLLKRLYSCGCLVFAKESHRAVAAGALAGFICGWVAIFVPHTLFWGEAQLQNLIDKGRTPLPVFGARTSDLTALGYCIIDPMDPAAIRAGFSIGCSALLSVSKTIVIGLSLGTGIVGGHFWGPLFVGCAAGHFFSDVVNAIATYAGLQDDQTTFAYPCLVILCTMGAAHVVSFRAHMAIMLILTLTISTFSPQDENPYYAMAGDYAAVFPLLVISVFISMIMSQGMVFYNEQANRGDILAVHEVLQEPGTTLPSSSSSSDSASEGESRGVNLTLPEGSPTSSTHEGSDSTTKTASDYVSVSSVVGAAAALLWSRDAIDKNKHDVERQGGFLVMDGLQPPQTYGATTDRTVTSAPPSPNMGNRGSSKRLDDLLAVQPSPSNVGSDTRRKTSSHRVVNSSGEIRFAAPDLFTQARSHRESLSRRNSLSSNASDAVDAEKSPTDDSTMSYS